MTANEHWLKEKSLRDFEAFTDNWEEDWHCVAGDEELSGKLILIFDAYLTELKNKGVAKSTFNRHSGSCHALGGYIVDRIFNYQWDSYDPSESGEEILLRYLDGYDGPLVFDDNESLQRQMDTTCRKLYRFINRRPV